MKLDSLAGKVALITGAASGIGEATAKRMAESGAKLALVDYNEAGVVAAARAFEEAGTAAIAIPADISERGAGDRAVKETVSQFGRIDIGMNIAGISGRRPILEMTDEEWDRMIGIDLYGTFSFCRAMAREMIPQHSGVIVNCSSVRAFSGVLNATHYTAAKAGVVGLTYSLAIELKPHGIRVNVVAPGGTATNLGLTMGRTAEQIAESRRTGRGSNFTADQVGRLMTFMASDESDALEGQALGVVRYNGMNTGMA